MNIEFINTAKRTKNSKKLLSLQKKHHEHN